MKPLIPWPKIKHGQPLKKGPVYNNREWKEVKQMMIRRKELRK